MGILKNNKVEMTVFCRNVRKFAPKFEISSTMKKFFLTFCGFLAAVLTLASCLGSNDSETTTYNDTAIKTFKLGTLNRYLHTKTKTGKDSVYKATYSASSYKVDIDQLNHRIFNCDSLLIGTDISRVVCTVTTVNNGIVYLKSMTSDSLTYFNSGTDSVDFSKPRIFRVLSTDGTSHRDYTVSLSVRQQAAGVFQWSKADAAGFPKDGDAEIRKAAEAAGMTYLGKNYVEAYAMSSDGRIMESEDNGKSWKADMLDTDASLLPTSSLAYTSWMLDLKTDYALLVGKNNSSDKAMTLWRKLADYDKEGKWVYMPLAEDNPYYLPKMDYVALAYYNGWVLAFGSNQKIYVSRDQGITWKTSSNYAFPLGFSATTGFKVAVSDDDDSLWLTDPATGQTWKGTLTE